MDQVGGTPKNDLFRELIEIVLEAEGNQVCTSSQFMNVCMLSYSRNSDEVNKITR